jgi:hypothetical protein
MLHYLRFAVLCVALALTTALAVSPAWARIQDGSADVCWSPDNEFPVPCNDDDD